MGDGEDIDVPPPAVVAAAAAESRRIDPTEVWATVVDRAAQHPQGLLGLWHDEVLPRLPGSLDAAGRLQPSSITNTARVRQRGRDRLVALVVSPQQQQEGVGWLVVGWSL